MFIEVETVQSEKMVISLINIIYIKDTTNGCLIKIKDYTTISTKLPYLDVLKLIEKSSSSREIAR